MDNLQEEYEKETGNKCWTNPVCHGERAFFIHNYVEWLEAKIREMELEKISPKICTNCGSEI